MITVRFVKRKALNLLVMSILLFLSASVISYSVEEYNNLNRIKQRLTSETADAISRMDDQLAMVSTLNIQDKINFTNYLDTHYGISLAAGGIEMLVYQKDSLKYWSDNVFVAPTLLTSSTFSDIVEHTGNGYYLVRKKLVNDCYYVIVQLIKSDYYYSNEYLQSKFSKAFKAPANVLIGLNESSVNISDSKGNFLYSIYVINKYELPLTLQHLLLTIYSASFLFLFSFILSMLLLAFLKRERRWIAIVLYVCSIVAFRIIQYYLSFPFELYNIQIFRPTFFASSEMLPTLGDYLINSVLALQIAVNIKKKFSKISVGRMSLSELRKAGIALSVIGSVAFYYLNIELFSRMVLDSSISFDFKNIFAVSDISHFAILIIAIIALTIILLLQSSIRLMRTQLKNSKQYIVISVSLFILVTFISLLSGIFSIWIVSFLGIFFFLYYIEDKYRTQFNDGVYGIIFFSVVFAFLTTIIISQSDSKREHQNRHILALKLAEERDNLLEYYYSKAEQEIVRDTMLQNMLFLDSTDLSLGKVRQYIEDKYFSNYSGKYQIQITICKKGKTLRVLPDNALTDCEQYFNSKIVQYLKPVSAQGLYFLKKSINSIYYLGAIKIINKSQTRESTNIFIETSSIANDKSLGYPELLIDNRRINRDDLSEYSYAFYENGELVKNVGKIAYRSDIKDFQTGNLDQGFFNENGVSHYLYNIDAGSKIFVSKERASMSESLLLFTYIFLLLCFIFLLINIDKQGIAQWRMQLVYFKRRLQIVIIAIIVVSSVILVSVSLIFINRVTQNKNKEMLGEKNNSILIDLESRFDSISDLDVLSKDELSDLLINLSNTYFTDINLYDNKGYLVTSSRNQIFSAGLVSSQMNPRSRQQFLVNKHSYYIQDETIGNYSFLSAYTPLRNKDNKVLGYLNLPYFAKQDDLKNEISGLLSAFANLYFFIISITVLLTIILSRYITKPIQLIGNQFSTINLKGQNKKIHWARKDEIGQLIEEYNKMIDKMEESALLLARSERESAWREMARQVAHEIKNPLTPIKLNVQLLMRAWEDKDQDWEFRLRRFSQSLLMQIDTLSSIATEFSDFAQMPQTHQQKFDVIPLLRDSIDFFQGQTDCVITFVTDEKDCIILADPKQIIRVINNLIKNALQAIPEDRTGLLRINVACKDSYCHISFKDNGMGIAEGMQAKIFSPNFTTKTTGMGLGLAMVKNIIENSAGKISFETALGEGTTFIVYIPMINETNELG